ncbi:MAG TPA: hypothetical protein VNN73_13820 [Blastocatellia bacterium]|nr:hypothetical protein [Blastocatellia bacterium]
MIIQLIIALFVFIAVTGMALAIAGVSLSIFAKFLKRSEPSGKEHGAVNH